MMKTMNPRRIGVAVAMLLAVGVMPASAQELPSAASLLQKYIDAVGGREAMLKPGATRSVGTFEMPAAGMAGQLEIITESPNRMTTKVTIDGLGDIYSGTDGKVSWSMDPMTGARLLEGAELAAVKDGSTDLAAVRDPSLVESMETVERTEVRGEACYRVKVVWKSGRETADCYAVDSGLIVATMMKQESPMGDIELVTHMSEYRDFDGLRLPTRMVQAAMGMEQIMVLTTIERKPVGTWPIEPPAQVRALIDG